MHDAYNRGDRQGKKEQGGDKKTEGRFGSKGTVWTSGEEGYRAIRSGGMHPVVDGQSLLCR